MIQISQKTTKFSTNSFKLFLYMCLTSITSIILITHWVLRIVLPHMTASLDKWKRKLSFSHRLYMYSCNERNRRKQKEENKNKEENRMRDSHTCFSENILPLTCLNLLPYFWSHSTYTSHYVSSYFFLAIKNSFWFPHSWNSFCSCCLFQNVYSLFLLFWIFSRTSCEKKEIFL